MGINVWDCAMYLNRDSTFGLIITGDLFQEAVVGEIYDGFTVTAFGGTGPYTYSLQGTWDTGFTVDSTTGVVSGTPAAAGTYTNLSVRATDYLGATADLAAFTMIVAPAPDPLSISGTPVTSGDVGDPYTFTVTAANGDTPYTYSLVGTWPLGVSVDNTGVVSGTLGEAGTFTGLSVRVTDSLGNTADIATFTLTVAAALGSQVGFASNAGATALTIPAHQVGDTLVTIAARTDTHGGVGPTVTIDGSNPWVLWQSKVDGVDRAIAVYYMTAISTTHTVAWNNNTGQKAVWVFRGKVPDQIYLHTEPGPDQSVLYPEL